MSTRELLYSIIDNMTEQQMRELIEQIEQKPRHRVKAEDVAGILSEYANPDFVPLEKGAWERAAAEKYENS